MEPVLFESFPGFYSTASLYRPEGEGPFPALIHAHGHKPKGRFQEDELFGVQSGSVQLARMGILVLAPDMLGYNDSLQFPHGKLDRAHQLWGMNTMGLQTLTSLRALDYLETLPEVDRDRIGILGWSGGGDQTVVAAAIDERIKLAIPMVTTSVSTQATCPCGNQPGLRHATNQVEMTSLMAPKPMLLVSCTGDFTWETPEIEFPAIRSVYALYGAADKTENAHIEFDWHSFELGARTAAYKFVKRTWGLQASTAERTFKPVDLSKIPIFPGGKLPPQAADQTQLLVNWKKLVEKELSYDAERDDFESVYRKGLRLTLGVELPDPRDVRSYQSPEGPIYLHRPGGKDRVRLDLKAVRGPVTLLVSPEPIAPQNVQSLEGTVAVVKVFSAPRSQAKKDPLFDSFHLSDVALKVQDILTAAAFLRREFPQAKLRLVGTGEAGLWCLLAAAVDEEIDFIVADAAEFACDDDEAYLEKLDLPGLRRLGDFPTVLKLISSEKVLIHNTGAKFTAAPQGRVEPLTWDEIKQALQRR